ncbi:MAG: carbohydrate ABC transporter permease [Caldilineaceae bacterium SB0664_bin_22]|nr:carbohydrate ABC transporter permease [Caldilineaceae bacterium SB0664_bin_22]
MADTQIVKPIGLSSARPRVVGRRGRAVRYRLGRLMLYGVLLLGGIISLIPFAWMMSASLMTLGETVTRQLLPSVPRFENYGQAWQDANFARYFLNSIVISAAILAGQLSTSILAGYAFARIEFKGRSLIFSIMLSTLMIQGMVTMIPNFLVVANRVPFIPLPGGSWLNTLQGITVPGMASVFSIFLLRQFFAQIPWELWDAARIDGSGHNLFLVRVVLPLSKPAIFTVTVFVFIGAWNEFLWPLLVTTTETWRPIMVGLYRFAEEAGPLMHLMMAGSMITIVPILILYFLTQKQYTEGIALTGLKG